MEVNSSPLALTVSQDAYRRANEEVWSTKTKFDWYLRRNRVRLVKAGAMVMVGGAWRIHVAAFDAEAMSIAREDAARWLDREAGKAAA